MLKVTFDNLEKKNTSSRSSIKCEWESFSLNVCIPEDPEECVDSPGEGFMSTEPS